MHIVRNKRTIAGELSLALRNPTDLNNVVLEDGDSVIVPGVTQTVLVAGAVVFEAAVLYRPNRDLQYYLDQAGGLAHEADKGRITVTYPSGERRVVRKNILFTSTPSIQPGSTVFVPAKPDKGGTNWDQIVTRISALAGTVATLLIVYNQIK
jgi:protein involved in polysaccharide export with SLBB domain